MSTRVRVLGSRKPSRRPYICDAKEMHPVAPVAPPPRRCCPDACVSVPRCADGQPGVRRGPGGGPGLPFLWCVQRVFCGSAEKGGAARKAVGGGRTGGGRGADGPTRRGSGGWCFLGRTRPAGAAPRRVAPRHARTRVVRDARRRILIFFKSYQESLFGKGLGEGGRAYRNRPMERAYAR